MTSFGAASDIRDCPVQFIETALDDREQFLAMSRELDVASRAIEKPEPDTGLQFPDQDAEPRWRDEQRFGRSREVAVLSDETERAQLPGADFHC